MLFLFNTSLNLNCMMYAVSTFTTKKDWQGTCQQPTLPAVVGSMAAKVGSCGCSVRTLQSVTHTKVRHIYKLIRENGFIGGRGSQLIGQCDLLARKCGTQLQYSVAKRTYLTYCLFSFPAPFALSCSFFQDPQCCCFDLPRSTAVFNALCHRVSNWVKFPGTLGFPRVPPGFPRAPKFS